MADDSRTQAPYGSFDSAETARKATGGKVYDCRGFEGHAIIVEDPGGRNWLYVKPESPKYRDAGNAVWGHRMAQDGKDADHIASRGIEAQQGQGYVLLGAVDSSANRSHGSYEKPGRHLDRPFNAAAQQTAPDRAGAAAVAPPEPQGGGPRQGRAGGRPGAAARGPAGGGGCGLRPGHLRQPGASGPAR